MLLGPEPSEQLTGGVKIKHENLIKILEQNPEVGGKLKSQNEALKKYVHPWDQSVANIPKFLLPPS